MNNVGDRVGAVLGMENNAIEFLGYGVYEGDFIPETAVGVLGKLCRAAGHKNPRIRLDSGKVVYGCECWWGSETKIKEQLKNKAIVQIDIDDVRKEFADEKSKKAGN